MASFHSSVLKPESEVPNVICLRSIDGIIMMWDGSNLIRIMKLMRVSILWSKMRLLQVLFFWCKYLTGRDSLYCETALRDDTCQKDYTALANLLQARSTHPWRILNLGGSLYFFQRNLWDFRFRTYSIRGIGLRVSWLSLIKFKKRDVSFRFSSFQQSLVSFSLRCVLRTYEYWKENKYLTNHYNKIK